MIHKAPVNRPTNDRSHAEELQRLRRMIHEKSSSKDIHQLKMLDDGAIVVSESGKHLTLNSLKLMDKAELSSELSVTLTVATLLLGVVLSLMVSVNRDEIDFAVLEDLLTCETHYCVVRPAYHHYIYISGIVTAEICGGCMITVVLMQFSFNLLHVNAKDIIGGAVEYHTYRYIVGVMHGFILLAFVAVSYCALNVIFVKIRDFKLQVRLFYISCSFWLMMLFMIGFITRLHRISKANLEELYHIRVAEFSYYEKRLSESHESSEYSSEA